MVCDRLLAIRPVARQGSDRLRRAHHRIGAHVRQAAPCGASNANRNPFHQGSWIFAQNGPSPHLPQSAFTPVRIYPSPHLPQSAFPNGSRPEDPRDSAAVAQPHQIGKRQRTYALCPAVAVVARCPTYPAVAVGCRGSAMVSQGTQRPLVSDHAPLPCHVTLPVSSVLRGSDVTTEATDVRQVFISSKSSTSFSSNASISA
jgi:hypothetical protein